MSTEADRPSFGFAFACGAVLLASAAVRLAASGCDLWFDEIWTLDLIANFVPLFAELLRVALIHPPQLVDELLFRDHPVADSNCGVASGGSTGTTSPPIDKDQEDKNRNHAPQDELEMPEIVTQPL